MKMNTRQEIRKIFIWTLFGLSMIICSLALSGCKTRYIPIETKITETVTVHDSIIEVKLIPYKDSVSVAADSSFLSNPYAYSYAGWDGEKLNHSLGIWENAVTPFKVMWLTHYKTIEVAKPYPVEKEVFIEKNLSGWQNFRIWLGNILLIIAGGWALWTLIKRFLFKKL